MDAKDAYIGQLEHTVKSLEIQVNNLTEMVLQLRKDKFGSSSEKTPKDEIDGQLGLFDEAETVADASVLEPIKKEVNGYTRTNTKTKREEIIKDLPVREILCDIPEESKYCANCGTTLKRIGTETVREELEYIPAKLQIVRYVRTAYECSKCKHTDTPYIEKAPTPTSLMNHSLASPSSVANVMYQKYVNGMPLYRQEKDWKEYGAAVSRTTLANWIIYSAGHYFRPLYDYFHRQLLLREFLMADETRVQVLKEPGRSAESQSFMWLYRTGEDGLPVILLYGYTPTRSGDNAADFLDGFQGYLETDGYQGYNKVSGIKRCSCWAHIRRYFVDAIPKGKQLDYNQPAVQGVHYCDRLARLESSISGKCGTDYEKRKQMRLEKEKPVLEAFWTWVDSQKPVRNTRLDKALTYVKNRRETSMTYLEDGRCSFTNNLSENAIRPFTVGRKNWLFSDSVEGAEASAIAYTMVEMAKAHNLNIYQYLSYVLEQRPNENWSDEQLAELAPWSEKLQTLKM